MSRFLHSTFQVCISFLNQFKTVKRRLRTNLRTQTGQFSYYWPVSVIFSGGRGVPKIFYLLVTSPNIGPEFITSMYSLYISEKRVKFISDAKCGNSQQSQEVKRVARLRTTQRGRDIQTVIKFAPGEPIVPPGLEKST